MKSTAFAISTDARQIGFVDGSQRPAGRAAADFTLIGDEDAGFSWRQLCDYSEVFLHDMAGWNALMTVEQQGRIIGRKKMSNIELDADVKPSCLLAR